MRKSDILPESTRKQHNYPFFPALLVGNKVDLFPVNKETTVTMSDNDKLALAFANQELQNTTNYMLHISGQTGDNVSLAITTLLDQIVQYQSKKSEILQANAKKPAELTKKGSFITSISNSSLRDMLD